MAFFDNPDNVQKYIEMSDGSDGRALVSELQRYLPRNRSVLELGMGPGKDLLLLSEHYRVIGSDGSRVFVDDFKKQHPEMDVSVLDAVAIDTDITVDCIYSNKVLHHLSREDLTRSLSRQFDVLKDDGILCHSFWRGDKEAFIEDLRFVYYTEDAVLERVKGKFEVLKIAQYGEFEDEDSFFVILRKSVA